MMITLEGKSVFGGVAIGKIQFYKSHHNGRNRTSEKTIKYRKINELLLVKKVLNIIESKMRKGD